ncbi:DEAD/DEAH box helicase family protein [Tyzzerella sp. An114]|uniref:DEAD/DEAH box helicase family protein n=1 Tax=Tyzzerella sp. An114 TaxID=1965545 RepID=UPI001302CE44|nr:DEAD/DEAH box helicase family protein [Tyzzerella sp. An114]
MIKESYTEKYYTYHSKYISNVLALRPPQEESLDYFARLCDIISLKKNPTTMQQIILDNEEEYNTLSTIEKKYKFLHDKASSIASDFYADDLKNAQEYFKTLSSFERDFPSVCFALATGIGKTRLMGACIAYLRYEKGIKNFFVMAPNLTIYRKLKSDLGNPSNPKYVFKGLDLFVNPPRIVDGENYDEFRQMKSFVNDVTINVFNISKLNSDSKVKAGQPARIKRLSEVLGESYFSYLQSLPDLCIFMDESHHYHADKSFDVINELRPILGVELTATPQIQKGAKKIPFKNVIYEYSLAHALNDEKYVKVPAVFTRKDFRPEEYTEEQLDHEKLNDGLRLHEDTKSKLEIYARTFDKPVVKPFVLVVARDTDHSKEIMKYIKSNDFFNGYYADKVMEINSAQRGAEKDENIEQLLSLENPDNKIEIVIHVNMLKEGWDVTNLYTIIPLRASASETLTEQTIGRGLRLPYGERTGVDEVDRLSIVSHDKYEAIINLANDPESLVRKIYYIDDAEQETEGPKETIEMPTTYDSIIKDVSFTEQLAFTLMETPTYAAITTQEKPKVEEQVKEVAKFVASYTSTSVTELNRQIKTFNAVKDPEIRESIHKTVVAETIKKFPHMNLNPETLTSVVEKAINTCVQALTDYIIPIPQTVIQPFNETKRGFVDFNLETKNMNWHPSNQSMIGTELREGGETFEYNPEISALTRVDTVENEIVRHIIVHDNIDYSICADLLYKLVGEAKTHFCTYLSEKDAIEVMYQRQTTIADLIYAQMMQHFYTNEVKYRATEMRPFSRIETGFGCKIKSDEIYDLRATIPASKVRSKVFNGFKKACHTLYKFDSDTERKFAIVLENDKAVNKWMRPSPKQFNIYYGPSGMSRYEPDFIVETDNEIFMIETKASNEINSKDVLEKAKAAEEYCKAASEWNGQNQGKPWTYVLISHDEVRLNSSFKYLVENRVQYE